MNPSQLLPATVLSFFRAAFAMVELCINPSSRTRRSRLSLPPPPSSTPAPLLATFPPEIVHLIIDQLSLTFLTNCPSLAPLNRATARAVCLVSRAFWGHGRRLLFERMAVRYGYGRKEEGEGFLKAKKVWWMLQGREEREIVRVLEVYVAAYTDENYLQRIFETCPNLTEIHFSIPFSSFLSVPWSPSTTLSHLPILLSMSILEPCTGTLSTFSASRYLTCGTAEPQVHHLVLQHYDALHSWPTHSIRFPSEITLVDCGRDLIVSILDGTSTSLSSFSLVTTALPRREAQRYPIPLLPALRKLSITIHLSNTDLSPLETVDTREQMERLVRRAGGLESLELDLDETSEGVVNGGCLEGVLEWLPGGMKMVRVRVRGREGRTLGEEEQTSEEAFLKGCAERGVLARVQRW